ncbi:DUF6087 family protein [Kitasatospora sp. NPDC086791]|uniref:DUF6087 family protein n=1 Tax=Kitasatospora sp. NPDC086791 TaxID=3155178 RepID=UPI0034484B32
MGFPDDESLAEWYAARAGRDRPEGTRDAIVLVLVPEERHGRHPSTAFPGWWWSGTGWSGSRSESRPTTRRRTR